MDDVVKVNVNDVVRVNVNDVVRVNVNDVVRVNLNDVVRVNIYCRFLIFRIDGTFPTLTHFQWSSTIHGRTILTITPALPGVCIFVHVHTI